MTKDSRIRSATKSFTWRVMGIVLLLTMGYIVTGSAGEASMIAFMFHFVRLTLYYVHERIWEGIKWGRRKSSLLPFYVWLAALAVSFIILGIIAWG